MSDLSLDVFLHGTPTGELVRDRIGRMWFNPAPEWLERGALPSMGVAFERDRGPRFAGTGLPVWFEHLLPPQGGMLRRRICEARALRSSDGASLLRLLGRDLPGAIEVRGDASPAPQAEAPLDLRIGFSLAGMQLKFSLSETGDRFAVPARGTDGAWIVKLPSEDLPDLPAVEHCTMRWAAACGFAVPETRVIATSNVEGLGAGLTSRTPAAFAVRRFDRAQGRRVHQEDFAQALEVGPEHIYGDSGPLRASNDGLLRLVRDAVSPDAALEFARRLAFVVVSGNTDAHLKNWSFQWKPTSVRPHLAPMYDQVATLSWAPYGWQGTHAPRLALAIGRCRSFAQLDLEHLETFARRGGVLEARDAFMDSTRVARAAWEVVEGDAPELMRSALREHWRRVPLLRR